MIAVGRVPDRRPRRGRGRTPRRSPARSRARSSRSRHPAAAARVRRRRRGADRHRGDRHRRAGLQAARGRRTRRRPWRSWPPSSAILFIGITFLAVELRDHRRSTSRRSRRSSPRSPGTVYGDGVPFYLFQAFTALLLFLAANTSFNAFPRLLAILAGDGYMPRQFALRGDRLAFSYGIIVLASLAAALIVIFDGETHAADPALRGRRVHRLHDQPDRHDPALAARAVAGLAQAPGDQRLRRGADRRSSR